MSQYEICVSAFLLLTVSYIEYKSRLCTVIKIAKLYKVESWAGGWRKTTSMYWSNSDFAVINTILIK